MPEKTGKNWWESKENWVGVIGALLEAYSFIDPNSKIPQGAPGTLAALIMIVVRNLSTSEPIKQFNFKLKEQEKKENELPGH